MRVSLKPKYCRYGKALGVGVINLIYENKTRGFRRNAKERKKVYGYIKYQSIPC